jgi:hypothetical protein
VFLVAWQNMTSASGVKKIESTGTRLPCHRQMQARLLFVVLSPASLHGQGALLLGVELIRVEFISARLHMAIDVHVQARQRSLERTQR